MNPRIVPWLNGLLASLRAGPAAADGSSAGLRGRAEPSGVPAAPALSPIGSLPNPARDRRASDRVPLRRGALLELPGARRAAVNLLDLSIGGAALMADGIDARPGVTGALMIGTALLPVVVVAVSDGRVHLAFQSLSPKAESSLRGLLWPLQEPAMAA
jgi:hypothetical protein